MPEHLYKSRTNKVFAGVCGGLAEYFHVDPTLIRLGWALAVFVGGTGLILYILAMIIMPEEPVTAGSKSPRETAVPAAAAEGEQVPDDNQAVSPASQASAGQPEGTERDNKRQQILGLILVCVGGYFILERFFPFFNMHNWWPLILIAFGLFLLLKGKGESRR